MDWPYLKQVFRLDRRIVSTTTGEIQEQVIYGIISQSRAVITPKNLLKKIRAYWGAKMAYTTGVMLLYEKTAFG